MVVVVVVVVGGRLRKSVGEKCWGLKVGGRIWESWPYWRTGHDENGMIVSMLWRYALSLHVPSHNEKVSILFMHQL